MERGFSLTSRNEGRKFYEKNTFIPQWEGSAGRRRAELGCTTDDLTESPDPGSFVRSANLKPTSCFPTTPTDRP